MTQALHEVPAPRRHGRLRRWPVFGPAGLVLIGGLACGAVSGVAHAQSGEAVPTAPTVPDPGNGPDATPGAPPAYGAPAGVGGQPDAPPPAPVVPDPDRPTAQPAPYRPAGPGYPPAAAPYPPAYSRPVSGSYPLTATPYPPGGAPGAAGPPGAPPPFPGLARWRTGRFLSGSGTAFSLLGTGLVLSGLLTAAAYNDKVGTYIVYGGSASHTLGFMFSATGLSMQHRALEESGVSYSRVTFGLGTALNAVGLVAVGASYVIAATNIVPSNPDVSFDDRTTAGLVTSLTGSILMSLGGILYFADSRKMRQLAARFGTF